MKSRMTLLFFLATLCTFPLLLSHFPVHAGDVQLVTVRKGDTVSYLCFKIYGLYNPRILDAVRKENPGVQDMNMIYAGQELRFPTPAALKMPPADQKPQPPGPGEPSGLQQMKATANKAVITYLEGQVQVRKSAGAAWSAAGPNQILCAGDEIRVLSRSRAELILDNQSVMRLAENTRLVLRQLDLEPASGKETTSVGLSLGKLWTKASKVFNPSSRLEVRTPTAIAGVQGTVYQVSVADEHATQIQVYEGAVAVYRPFPPVDRAAEGSAAVLRGPREVQGPQPVEGPRAVSREEWTEIILRKAQQMTVTDRGIPRPVSFSIDSERRSEWVRWNEQRDADFRPPQRPH